MDITDIKIRLVPGEDQLRAFATVVFDSVLVVHNIKVIYNGERLIVAMPSRVVANGGYKDVVHPINSSFRELLSRKVLAAYQEKVAQEGH